MKHTGRQRNRRGFTMAEVLTVIAILAILAALAIPAVAQLRGRLGMARLDETARQIFLAAQNEMTAMKASGRLEAFAADLNESGTAVSQAPADYPAGDESWKNLYAVSASEASAQTYLLRAGSALRDAAEGGDFLVELDSATGDVYGVFYAQDTIDYSEVQTLCAHSRDRSVRQLELLGYYGGSVGGSGAVGVPKEFYPQASVNNGEELFLTVTCDDLLLLRGTQSSLLLTVTVEDEHGQVWSKRWNGGTDEMFVNGDSVTVSLVLDSLDPAFAFRTVTEGALTPGDTLTITAAMSYAHNGVNISGAAAPVTVNSLFDSRDGEGNLTVSRVRHLDNLRASRYSGPSGKTITQAQTIQFAFQTWTKGVDFHSEWTQSPLTAFAPIEHASLLKDVTYDGNGNALTGFPITGENAVGLFASVTGGTLRNIRLVDCAVSATGNSVGALAGKVTDTAVENCGVFLTSLDEYGRFLKDMPQRLERYSVTGNGYVGGLIGSADGKSPITDSFAAVHVTSQKAEIVGGLVGAQGRGAITNCYASGAVTGVDFVGGLVGYNGSGGPVNGCYSTAQVTGTNAVGGLVGSTTGRLTDCTVYGQVNTTGPLSGGIAGSASSGVTNCRYLSQAGYNDALSSSAGTPTGYLSLKTTTPNAVDSSRPYKGALVGNAFPFPLLYRTVGESVPMLHYGNWPAELRLQTSLVYYERYEDQSYGYYARTSLTTEGESSDESGQVNTWVVDTLQDRVCVEDGYALLTTAALDSFTYSRNAGETQTVKVSAVESKITALPLESDVSLRFENDNGSTYSITGARAYRLPYVLQTTGHTSAANSFYDRLTIGDTGGGKTYQFYYCADFAKNAVNPDLNNNKLEYPQNPSGFERPVYVRSARQLNLLGQTTYYWSDQNSSLDFYFLQETEIDFAKYVKSYCGEPYDMMDTQQANSHRNRPIGRPGGDGGGRFTATYDGGGNPIVDYRCITYQSEGYQFTGLFGEIYQGTLKNIVMTASDPENRSGYVESNFYDAAEAYRPGVGALVGLIYVEPGDAEGTYGSVSNCAVSGYTVRYTGTGSSSRAYAVGGLVGFSFGKISNASAVSYCVDGVSGAGSKYVGGLVGSLNGRGSITNCYTGGTLYMTSTGGTRSVGGLSGGFEDIYGLGTGDNNSQRATRITNSYSYCTLSSAFIKGSPTVSGVSPANSRLSITNSHYLSDQVSGVSVGSVSGAAAKTAAELMLLGDTLGGGSAAAANTHPWSVSLQNRAYSFPAFVKSGGDYVHYGDWPRLAPVSNTLTLAYYEQYTGETWGVYALHADGTVTDTLDVRDEKTITAAGYGLLSQGEGGTVTVQGQTFLFDQAKGSVIKSGISPGYTLYAFHPTLESQLNKAWSQWAKSVSVTLRTQGEDGETAQTLYLNTVFGAAIWDKADHPATMQLRTPEQLKRAEGRTAAWTFLQTHNIVISPSQAGQIGRLNNNSGGSAYNGNGHTIHGLTMPLFYENAGHLTNLRLTGVNVSGSGNQAGLALTVNGGTIANCSVTGDVTSVDANAAGLVYKNSGGVVEQCYVKGSVTAEQGAAGLAYENTGTIRTSYANCAVIAEEGSASAFVWNQNGASIQDCYAAGSVTAAQTASGFKGRGGGGVTRCYTVAELDAGNGFYGFGPGNNNIQADCVWAADTAHSGTQMAGGGTESTLSGIAKLNLGSAWEKATKDTSHPDKTVLQNKAYPYPKIAALDHYGDWPAFRGGKIGAFQTYNGNRLHGCVLDLRSGDITPYASGTNGQKDYGILFDDTFYADRDNWTVVYQERTILGTTNTQEIPLRGDTENPVITQTTGLIANIFRPSNTFRTVTAVIFTNHSEQTTYTFQYDNGTFTYFD